MSLTIASVAGKQRFFTLTCLAHEITGVKVAQKKRKQTVSLKLAKKEKMWHKFLADDTANSNTSITSRVSQFSKNLEEPSPTEKEEASDVQIRSMDSHEILCERECWSDLRADTGTLFLPGKIVMEQHSSTPSPSQSWSKATKSSGFEESVVDSINDQNSKPTVNPGRRSAVMELANDSKFSGEQTTIATSSLNTIGTKRKYKSADDDRMQVYENMNGVIPKAEASRPTRSRYAQNTPSTEMISGSLLHGHADKYNQLPGELVAPMESKEHKEMDDLAGTQAHHHEQQWRRELSIVAQDNDAKYGDVNSRQEAHREDRPQYYVFDRGSTWKHKVYQLVKCMDDLLQIRLCPLRDTERSTSTKGHTSEQNMTTR